MAQIAPLEPANSIIAAFGGLKSVVDITGASRTRVYRWTQPRKSGGTGGLIPINHAQTLLEYARRCGIPVTADTFLPSPSREEDAAPAASCHVNESGTPLRAEAGQ